MRPFALALLAAFSTTFEVPSAPTPAPDGELERVAAFARLCGVVRHFCPSDAAAALDRNRFAIHGVSRVRAARDAKAVRTTLAELFVAVAPTFGGLRAGRDEALERGLAVVREVREASRPEERP